MRRESLFGELRSLLARPASSSLFDELVSLVDPFDTATINYLSEHSRQWPATIDRVLPVEWARLAVSRENVYALRLGNVASFEHVPISREGARVLSENLELMTGYTRLRFDGNSLTDELVDALAGTRFDGLRELGLTATGFSDASLQILGAAPLARQLTHLELSRNPRLSELAAATLARRFPSLTHLGLAESELSPSAWRELAHSRLATSLEQLDARMSASADAMLDVISEGGFVALELLRAGYEELSVEVLRWFGHSQHLPALRRLDLRGAQIDNDALAALFSGDGLVALTHLDLMDNLIEDGVDALARADLPALSWLDLGANGAAGALASLSDAVFAHGLEHLNLANNLLGDEGLLGLLDGERLVCLRELGLSGNELGDASAVALARAEWLNGLSELDLSWNELGDDGAAALANAPHFSSLESLELLPNPISDRGAEALANSPYLRDAVRERWA